MNVLAASDALHVVCLFQQQYGRRLQSHIDRHLQALDSTSFFLPSAHQHVLQNVW
jgi:hypothetical protein